ncbi:MAG TPA: signal peptidase I [Dehalococcoidia bacterium]|nr:signal peptidase I [Dehalococcoidia bacterium]
MRDNLQESLGETPNASPDTPESPAPYSSVWYTSTSPFRFQALDPEELRLGGPGLTATAQPDRVAKRRRFSLALREVVETLILALLIFLAVRASFQNFRVEGISMAPSLETGQYLIVNKLAYATIDTSMFDWLPFYDSGDTSIHHIFGVPKRGDVVVFRAPNTPERDFIKRIIGEPGDTVSIDPTRGIVYVNGSPLEEKYVQGRTSCFAGINACGPWVVPPKHYFVLGDNRQNSTDSRVFGFVPEENIVGKALLSYWPLDDFGLAPNHAVSFAQAEASP